ncbi:MAG: HIT domain-containing protein, partial [Thermodesulfobacteriota bacterium]
MAENALAVAFRDGYPVNPGHTLIIPRRHVATWFEATREEQVAVLDLLDEVKARLDAELKPDGYNGGFNAGVAAGQTVPHLHLHLIPRFDGDVDDPTGGVRFVIPARGNYRRGGGFLPTARETAGRRAQPLAAGGPGDPFLAHLVPLFARADDISILAAFVQDSGVQRLEPYLLSALERGARVRLLTGDYLNITQAHALRRVLDLGRGAAAEGEASGTLELRVVEV